MNVTAPSHAPDRHRGSANLTLTSLAWPATVLAALLSIAASAPAATVLERHVHATLAGDGSVRESLHLEVRLDHEDDVASWSTYQVALFNNRTLERLEAHVVHPDGRRIALRPSDQETIDGTSGGLFYASLRLHLARFPDLAPGAVIVVDQEVRQRPYHPTGRIAIRGAGRVEELRIVVDAEGDVAPPGWRWYLEGISDGLVVEEIDGGVIVHGTDLRPLDHRELAPDGLLPVLRYGWGAAPTWQDVGRWYRELAESVPRAPESVREQARSLTAQLEDPRRRLDALTGFLQDKVRNVAVMIGEGNYRPSPPGEVLERKWGDCKDKAVLLVDLLDAVGIEAYPTLINKNAKRRITRAFPSPDQFNHAIVAVPAYAVDLHPDDPVAGGYLFVDTTQTLGAGRWLDPDSQDQEVLVVRGDGAELVCTPLLPELEERRLHLDLTVADNGDAHGRAQLGIRGEIAYELLRTLGDLPPDQLTEEVRSILGRLLPGAELSGVTWRTSTEAVPALDLDARVALPGLVQGGDGRRSLQLLGMRATPDPQLLRERPIPMAIPARTAETTWNLTLPEGWCRPAGRDEETLNEVGSFRLKVANEPSGRLVLGRRAEVRLRWIGVDRLPQLRELALAEHRAHRRRTRLRCNAADS